MMNRIYRPPFSTADEFNYRRSFVPFVPNIILATLERAVCELCSSKVHIITMHLGKFTCNYFPTICTDLLADLINR